MKGKHVAVLMGGWSAEREVSIRSGRACADALERQGYRVTRVDVGRDIATVLSMFKPDAALNVLHGRPGEDGTLQGLLEIVGVPYSHSGVLASALAMQKDTAKVVLQRFGGQVPRTMEELVSLPGVGRKTANLVLILAFKSDENICVDIHVHRISNRLGWVRTRTPEETEQALYRTMERQWWPLVNLYLVTWGQNVCRPVSPRCGGCVLRAASCRCWCSPRATRSAIACTVSTLARTTI